MRHSMCISSKFSGYENSGGVQRFCKESDVTGVDGSGKGEKKKAKVALLSWTQDSMLYRSSTKNAFVNGLKIALHLTPFTSAR